MTDQRVLDAILRFGLDKASAGETKAGLDGIRRGLTEVEQQAARTRAQFVQLRAAGRELRQVGLEMGLVGAAIGGPLLAAAKAFVDANAKTSAVARAWQADTDKITANYQRIGGVVAREMLPAMDQAGKLVDKLATFAEQNPGLVKMALGASGALVAGGASLVVLGQATQTAANIGLLITALNKNATIAAAGGVGAIAGPIAGTAAVGVGAAAAGSLAAGGLIGLLSKLSPGFAQSATNPAYAGLGMMEVLALEKNTAATNANTAAHLNAPLDASDRHPVSTLPDYFYNAADRSKRQTEGLASSFYGGYNSETEQARAKALPAFQAYHAQKNDALLTWIDSRTKILDNYQKTYWDNEANYAQTRSRTVRDFETQETQAAQAFNTSRARQLRDFAESEAQSEKSYYENRLKAAAAFNTETVRAEQDHQDELAKLQSDHADRARDLAAAGDALGFVKEQRAYEKSRAESEKQYQKDTARRNQDYATQLKDGEAAFKEQREQRLKDFEQQQKDQADDFKTQQAQAADQQRQRLADMDHDFREQQDKLAQQRDQALTDLDTNYAKEQAHITQAFTDTLNAIDPILTGMKDDVVKNLELSQDAFANYLQGLTSIAGGGPGYCQPGYHWDSTQLTCVKDQPDHRRADGGYAPYGMTLLGERGREFVLSHETVSAAERLSGGPLTQEKILASLGHGGNSYSVNLGGISGHWSDRATALEGVLGLVDAKITEAFDSFAQEVGG